MAIDVHIHIHPFPSPDNGLRMPPRYEQEMRHNFALVGIPIDRQAEATVARMDAEGVEAAIVVNPYHLRETGHLRTNQSVHEAIGPYEGRLFALAGIDLHPQPDISALEQTVTEWGFRGLKLTLSARVRPNNFDLLDPVYRKLNELDLPVVWHPGPSGFGVEQTTWAYDMRDYYDLAVRYPDLKVVIAHCGNGTLGGHDLAITIAGACRNVYLETSAVLNRLSAEYLPPSGSARRRNFLQNYLYPSEDRPDEEREAVLGELRQAYVRFIRKACNIAPGKLMYGTDNPFADRWGLSIPIFREAIPDDTVRAEVLGDTARSVYRLDGVG